MHRRSVRPACVADGRRARVGAVVRLVLLPISWGQDFVVWSLVSNALLHGSNFYAHKPAHLPGWPYGYLPLFAYIEMPFRLLANVTPVPFTVAGKIPVLVGDVGVAWAISRWCRRCGVSRGREVAAVALWWLNPLVLYNGAFYGRFDSLCLWLLLEALLAGPPVLRADGKRSRAPIYMGLGIAAKTFPGLRAAVVHPQRPSARAHVVYDGDHRVPGVAAAHRAQPGPGREVDPAVRREQDARRTCRGCCRSARCGART